MAEDLYLRFAALLAAALLVPAVTFLMFSVIHKNVFLWRYASAGLFMVFVASALSSLRDFLPSFMSLLLSNLFVGVGYYLCLKSVRSVYGYVSWKYGWDEAILVLCCAGVIFVNVFYNTYEHRVIVISFIVIIFSFFLGLVPYYLGKSVSYLASVMLVIFSVSNAAFATGRLLAALPATDQIFEIGFWDPLFFIWSIAGTFLFSLAQFINGYTIIQRQNHKSLREAKLLLQNEQTLSRQLTTATEEQQNLQKLLLHELKRPLSAIQAALQSQRPQDTTLSRAKLERLQILTSQATAYLEGISQYQDISELFSAPNWAQVAVGQIAQDISTKWGVRVSSEHEIDGSMLSCDPLLIDIAISNLIENAQKFGSGVEGVSVRIGSANGKLNIDVEDDGPGIPEIEWQNVWRKFYKLDTETPSALTGCGLGLYVLARVAQAHGGGAYVVSETPSVIRLQLPLIVKANPHG